MRSFFSTFAAGSPKTKASPAGREQQPEEQLDGGGLAGAVGPEQAEDFALVDLQVEGVEGGLLLAAPEVAIDLGQASGLDDGIGHEAVSGRPRELERWNQTARNHVIRTGGAGGSRGYGRNRTGVSGERRFSRVGQSSGRHRFGVDLFVSGRYSPPQAPCRSTHRTARRSQKASNTIVKSRSTTRGDRRFHCQSRCFCTKEESGQRSGMQQHKSSGLRAAEVPGTRATPG